VTYSYATQTCQLTNDEHNKYIGLRGLTYIHTCRSYVHMLLELDRHVNHKSLDATHTDGPNVPTSHHAVTSCNIHHPSRAGRFVYTHCSISSVILPVQLSQPLHKTLKRRFTITAVVTFYAQTAIRQHSRKQDVLKCCQTGTGLNFCPLNGENKLIPLLET